MMKQIESTEIKLRLGDMLFTLNEDDILRIISAREATRKEKMRYANES